jgi:Luciferase-like monooxygenase
VGVGGVAQESEAMGSPYAERGAITDEAIAIMKELWTQDEPSFAGKYYRFSGMPFSPKPLQQPHIPILIGGNSRAAIRRAVRVGNGWHPFSISLEAVREGINYLREYAQSAGRAVSEIPVSVSLPLGHPTARGDALGTEPRAMVEKIQAFANLGVQTLVITGNTGNKAATLSVLDVLAQEVLPVFQ